jgi:uncharacterized membrane protein YgdD (TMEM256/DUF423 family)
MFAKQWMLAGSVFGFFSVALGAFGAHALKESLSERSLEIFQTGVQYQMFHSLALLALGVWSALQPSVSTSFSGYAFVTGVVLFSGSLYALAVTQIHYLGMITPLGGVSFLLGWASFAWSVLKSSS